MEYKSASQQLLWTAAERTKVHIELFLNSKSVNNHIHVVAYDIEMGLP